jgi:pimeloyl-ACP methyl ester carboxylesterase
MAEVVQFESAGLQLTGIVDLPPDYKPGEKRPSLIVLHGIGGHKDGGGGQRWAARQFAEWGYVVLRIDFRGCGDSEGERGSVIPMERVEDTKNAITYFRTRPEVDPDRIALLGISFGAAVAIYTAGTDQRVAAVIAQGGWADGLQKARIQHKTEESWTRFLELLETGRRHRERTGAPLKVSRYEIVPIPERLRKGISAQSLQEFTVDSAIATMYFRPVDVVGNIAPRPLLLLHAIGDGVTPADGSLELFRHSKQPTELYLLADTDHFMLSEENARVINLLRDWCARFFPSASLTGL